MILSLKTKIDDPDKHDELAGIISKVYFLCIYTHILMSPGLRGPWLSRSVEKSRCQASFKLLTQWVDIVGRRSGVTGKSFGWPRYVRLGALVPSVLIHLLLSLQPCCDSFRVTSCAARCAIHRSPIPIASECFSIVSAVQIVLDFV